ncbi:hypothetical protein BT69DRAFT_1304929 [Atractiella rhizophila]|nr:hypothetical protein BT69DRAFT_1304929 [Atractiella rhizophila]
MTLFYGEIVLLLHLLLAALAQKQDEAKPKHYGRAGWIIIGVFGFAVFCTLAALRSSAFRNIVASVSNSGSTFAPRRNKRIFYYIERVLKRLIRDPGYNLDAAQRSHFKMKAENYFRNYFTGDYRMRADFFEVICPSLHTQLRELSGVVMRAWPSESFLPLWERTTRQAFSGLRKAVQLVDYSMADPLRKMVRVALIEEPQERTENGISTAIVRWYQKEMEEDAAEAEKSSHLHNLPYLSKKRNGMKQDDGALLIRCAMLFPFPLLKHERSFPPEVAGSRLKKIGEIFRDEEAMGGWKGQILSLKDQVSVALQSRALDILQLSLTAGNEGEEGLLAFNLSANECEAAIHVVAQWILRGTTKKGTMETNGQKDTQDRDAKGCEQSFTQQWLGKGVFIELVRERAATYLINDTERSANLLSLYVDEVLRKQEDPLQTCSLDDAVKDALQIYSFLESKDILLELHLRRLARRIIRYEFLHEEKEREGARLLSGGESEHGRKILHVDSSNSLVDRFNDERKSDIGLSSLTLEALVQVNNVLTAFHACLLSVSVSTFPPSELDGVRCPREPISLHSQFNEFYRKEQRGRKLTYLLHLSTLELQTGFTKVKYMVQASVPQAAILFLFTEDKINDRSFRDCRSGWIVGEGCDPTQGLVKLRLLTDHIADFSSKKRRILLHPFNTEKDKEEVSAATKQVDKNRLMVIEAAIVRVMKCSKQLTRQNLVTNTIRALQGQFKPAVKDINIAIRILIEKEMLGKVNGEPDKYALSNLEWKVSRIMLEEP